MMGIKMIAKSRKEIRACEANISEKIREARRRWFGHVERETEEESYASIPLSGRKSRFSSAIPLSRFSVKMSRFCVIYIDRATHLFVLLCGLCMFGI